MARRTGNRKSRIYHHSPSRWPWLLIGFLGGGFLTSYLHHKQILPDFFPKHTPSITAKPQAAPIKKVPQFDFYTILKGEQKEQVQRPKPTKMHTSARGTETTATKAPVPEKVLPTKASYFLQAAALRDPKDADQLKAQLILAGYNVEIKKISRNKTTWFRVLIGPYHDKSSAEIAKQQLVEQHIKANLVANPLK